MSEEKRNEIVAYGLKRMKVIGISIIVTLALGFCLQVIGQSICYLITLIPLRRYAGGYHANSEKKCWAISFLMVFTSLVIMQHLNDMGVRLLIIGALFFSVFIWCLAPIENENKKLDIEEKRQYKNATRKILLTEIFSLLVFCHSNLQWVAEGIAISIITVGIVLILGILKMRATVDKIGKKTKDFKKCSK